LLPIALQANDAIRNLEQWMKPKKVWPTLLLAGTSSHVQVQPRGRCLVISPWNYPAVLTFGPVISAIAAGNTVVIKPSELTPHCSAAIAKVVRDVFPAQEVAVLEGDASVAQALLQLPFDHIFFTGSPAVGKTVMAAAAKHLTSVTLELGGKSPTVIDASADVELAAGNLMFSKFVNAGQTCLAPDHVYVHESVKDAFVMHAKKALTEAYGADPLAQQTSPHFARIVNPRHFSRIKGLLDDAKARGARILAGASVSEADCYIAPTLLDNVPADADLMHAEIFGPLLPIITFSDLDQVINQINAGPKPLALYIFSKTQAHIDRLLERTSTGGACVNHSIFHYVNASGIGKANGHEGFLAFSHERAVLRARVPLAASLLRAGELPMWLRNLTRSIAKWT
jgi:aldehyde dehydrogenase (NAD+)